MFREYFRLRRQRDAILAYQMGDFFEFYFEDARIVSETLGIALTRRGSTPEGEPIPMCGIPADPRFPGTGQGDVIFLGRSDEYFDQLVWAGHAVAVAVQRGVRDGMMQREVVATVHPKSIKPIHLQLAAY
jgi:DNA mismatch repair protein MutS